MSRDDIEGMAETLRLWGVPCTECWEVTNFCFSIDSALSLDSGAVSGLRPMLLTLRRKFGAPCIVMLCSECSTVDAIIPDGKEANSWAPAR